MKTWAYNKMAKPVKYFQLHVSLSVSMERTSFLEQKAGHSSAPGRRRCWEELPGERRLNSRDCFINTVCFLAFAPASRCSRQVCAGRLGTTGLQGWHCLGDQRGRPRGGVRAGLICSRRYRMEGRRKEEIAIDSFSQFN